MGRAYGEPTDVQARDDGRPTRFVWRGRLYTVGAILEHWVVNRHWWREGEPNHQGHPVQRGQRGQPELEFWRVEAVLGPAMTAGVYELRREAATDDWTVRQGLATGFAALVSPRRR